MGDVAAGVRQYPWIASITPFRARWRGEFNRVRLQSRKMPCVARRTAVGMWTTILMVVKIQGNSSLNRRKTHQQQYSDDEAIVLPKS
jgi:hypothetical protein